MAHLLFPILCIQMICYYKTVNLLYQLIPNTIISSQQSTMQVQIYVGTYEGTLIILQSDLNQIKKIKSMQISQNSLRSMCTVNDEYLVTGGFDQQLRVIDLHNYQEKVDDKQNVGQITKIVRVNQKYFIVGLEDGTLALWDRFHWNKVTTARFHKKSINSLVVLKQNKLLISAGGSKLILWYAQRLQKAQQYKIEKDAIIQHVRVSEDQNYIYYSNSKGQIYRIAIEDNNITLVLTMPTGRKIQDFLLYGKFLILGNDLGQVMVWQLLQTSKQTGKQGPIVHQLSYQKKIWYRAHESRIKQLKIVNSILLLVATAAGNLSIWDLPSYLSTVDQITQQIQLQDFISLCSIDLQSRILCAEVVARLDPDLNKAQQEQQANQKQDNVNEKKEKKKKNKKKMIKKEEKVKSTEIRKKGQKKGKSK